MDAESSTYYNDSNSKTEFNYMAAIIIPGSISLAVSVLIGMVSLYMTVSHIQKIQKKIKSSRETEPTENKEDRIEDGMSSPLGGHYLDMTRGSISTYVDERVSDTKSYSTGSGSPPDRKAGDPDQVTLGKAMNKGAANLPNKKWSKPCPPQGNTNRGMILQEIAYGSTEESQHYSYVDLMEETRATSENEYTMLDTSIRSSTEEKLEASKNQTPKYVNMGTPNLQPPTSN